MKNSYPRDLIGYGAKGKIIEWPNRAKLAVQFVLNYEEGGENCTLHGDKESEIFLSEIIGALPVKGRHMNMESFYEYGSRIGFWRLHKLFEELNIPVTIFGVAMALERNPEVCAAIKSGNYEIASHGWRWINYQNIKKAEEKKHMHKAIDTIKKIFGSRPLGWYTGRSSPYTREMVLEEGGFKYCSDSYADDLPYWEHKGNKKLLIIPYTLDNNDMRFATNQGFNSGDQLLKRFIEYIKKFNDVWICKRIDIANHWIEKKY